jgi:membrane protease YdiL (CAAX protease family)
VNRLSSAQPQSMPRRLQLVELAVFLLLIVPPMILPLFAVDQESLQFTTLAVATIIHDGALLALVLYFIWRGPEPFSIIGLRGHAWHKELLLGVILFIPFIYGVGWVESLFRSSGLSTPSEPPSYLIPQGGAQIALAFVLLVVVATAEEIIFRGYLIHRFHALTHDTNAAVLLATFVFAIGHGYEGSAGVATVAVMGLVFAAVYLWRGSLIAPMVLHFLNNFVGMIAGPLMGGH